MNFPLSKSSKSVSKWLPLLLLPLSATLLAGCNSPADTAQQTTSVTQPAEAQAPASSDSADTATTTDDTVTTDDTATTPATAEHQVLRVGASPVPHAEILEFVKPLLAEEGVDLEIVEFTDYVTPNTALDEGSIDLNFFQHQPYLDAFQADRPLGIVGGVKVHVEPIALYSNRFNSLEELPQGATIAIPSDPSNSGRALKLLEKGGLLTVSPDAGISGTVRDITENPKDFKFNELEAAQLPRALDDVDAAVINTNYALEANLNPLEDSLLIEDKDSPYANFVAGKPEMLNDARYTKLANQLQSDATREFILDHYKGAIVPAF